MRRSSQGKSSGGSGGASVGGIRRYDVHGGGGSNLLACYAKAAKPRPSKWDDAQKWLSRAGDDDGGGGATRRRSSCASADDGLLLPPPPPARKGAGGWRSWSNVEWEDAPAPAAAAVLKAAHGDEGEDTKTVDAVQAYVPQRCVVLLRDVGTEMTPGGSKEPSRANTPRVVAPAAAARVVAPRGTASPGQCDSGSRDSGGAGGVADLRAARKHADQGHNEAAGTRTALSPATAWGDAERAKYMARYRREEMKIQAWENRERRKAERQMRMAEEKAERMRLRAQARTAGKLATAQAEAKARRARAEAELALGRPGGGKGWLLTRSASWGGSGSGRSLSSSSSLSLRLPLLCS
uniref:Remorin C-terminal domain-containing protein n=1 Tax=Oryza punctata TaxID=4537 RepID=A0A0E0K221_ORYPU